MSERDETIIFHASVGAGPALVVLGGIHLDHTHLRHWLDTLSRTATVIYVDHRGTGQSPAPESFDGLDHNSWVSDIAALIDQLGLEQVVLFGHSYGGFLAQGFALRHPSRLDGLILCDTAPAMDYPDVVMANAQSRASPEQLEAVMAAFAEPVANDDALRKTWLDILPLYFHRYQPRYGEFFSDCIQYSARAYNRGFFECLPAFNTTADIRQIEVPTLILCGRHDWITPVEQGSQRLASAMPNARMVVFEESGHFPFIEEHDEFVSTVRRWLNGLNRGPRSL